MAPIATLHGNEALPPSGQWGAQFLRVYETLVSSHTREEESV